MNFVEQLDWMKGLIFYGLLHIVRGIDTVLHYRSYWRSPPLILFPVQLNHWQLLVDDKNPLQINLQYLGWRPSQSWFALRPSKEKSSQDRGPNKSARSGGLFSSITVNLGFPNLKSTGRWIDNNFCAKRPRVNELMFSLNNDRTTNSSHKYHRWRLIDDRTAVAISWSSSR